MLFQMLAGDVTPFKGWLILAIMKKHISDPPPAFAELGVSVPPEVEDTVRHTLQKEPDKRTSTVEACSSKNLRMPFIRLRSVSIPQALGGSLPVSSLTVRTEPPRSICFCLDNVAVGPTREDGTLDARRHPEREPPSADQPRRF